MNPENDGRELENPSLLVIQRRPGLLGRQQVAATQIGRKACPR